jgi:hypothetical protein
MNAADMTTDEATAQPAVGSPLDPTVRRLLADAGEALDELAFCARKLRHSVEGGAERKRLLSRIDAAIRGAERKADECKQALERQIRDSAR